MELIATDTCLILQPVQKGEVSVFIDRTTGQMSFRPSWDLAHQSHPECLGLVCGLVGRLKVHPECVPRLVLVQSCDRLCELPGRDFEAHGVYKVNRIVCVPISDLPESLLNLGLKPCPKHQPNLGEREDRPSDTETPPAPVEKAVDVPPGSALSKFGGSIKLMASDAVKSTAGNAAALASQVKVPWNTPGKAPVTAPPHFISPNISRMVERFEKRLIDEFGKLFNESDSFYFSFSGDLTNSLQRQMQPDYDQSLPLWRRVQDRFFFNKHLVQELIDLNDPRGDAFICPFIQGFVEILYAPLNFAETEKLYGNAIVMPKPDDSLPDFFTIAVISRRSRHRAGTRYKRRGVDEDGNVANFVETEQFLLYHHYALSFVMTRGSVPIYWSQPGYKYRPPPVLNRTEDEDRQAFGKHFEAQFAAYGQPIHCVSLVERVGREKVIADAYLKQAIALDDPNLSFIIFDFHEYCRGMHFENVSILLEALEPHIKAVRYCWMDSHGVVCEQQGIFRINCIDCLDRTNVVQTAIARLVLEIQLTKLGVVPPEMPLPMETKLGFQGMWANNGDVISRQYAGTNALKGDFTRTGERNISGMMKDGVNSASRYYLNQFRDAYRQATIDLLVGHPVSEELLVKNLESESAAESRHKMEVDNSATAEHVRILLDDCKKLLIPDLETVVGSWGLINNDPLTGDLNQEDMDMIFLLTQDAYFVAFYEDEADKVTQYQKVLLSNIEKVEFGVPEQGFNLIGRNSTRNEHSLRICYKMPSEDSNAKETGFFHMFRSTNLRFFNNMAIVVSTADEKIESMKSIADSICVAIELAGYAPDVWFGRLDKKKSRIPDLHSNFNVFPIVDVPVLKSVGSRALQNVTSQISKLNPMSRFRFSGKRGSGDPSANEDAGVVENPNQLVDPGPVSRLSPLPFDSPCLEIGDVDSEPVDKTQPRDPGLFQRQKSKSSDDLSALAAQHQALGPTSSKCDTIIKPEPMITPFAKITKGIQNFGANLGPKRPQVPVASTKAESDIPGEPEMLEVNSEPAAPAKSELEGILGESRTKVLLI